MSYHFADEDHVLFRDVIREFARNEVLPAAIEMDKTHEFPMKIWKRCGELGLTAMTLPEKYGGLDASLATELMVMEEIGRVSPTMALILDVHLYCENVIHDSASEEQKAYWLPKLASGEVLGGLSRSQPEGALNFPGWAVGATREGDFYNVNVTKIMQTNSVHSGVVVLDVKADDGKQISLIVDKSDPNVKTGHIEEKMGLNGSDTGTIEYQNVKVPVSNMLPPTVNLKAKFSGVPNVDVATICLGALEEAYDRTKDYLMNRKRPDGRSYVTLNMIGIELVKIATDIELANNMVYTAAQMWDDDQNIAKVGRMSKAWVCETALKDISRLIELNGAPGYIEDTGLTRLMRDVQGLCIAEGATHIMYALVSPLEGIPLDLR